MSDGAASLPEQWAVATIADLVGFGGVFSDGDWVESEDQDPSGDVRLIQLADVGDGSYRDRSSRFLTSIKAAELRCTFLKPGDLLIARMPDPLGRACVFPGDVKASITVVDVCVVRLESPICARWLMHHLNTPQVRRMIAKLQSGTTRKRISRANLATVRFPIPPLQEQVRIAARLDELLSDLDAGVKALETVRAKLRRYRASVLKAAVEGALTTEWRKAHPHIEPASELLERILAERRRRWEDAQLKKYKDTGKEPPKNWKAKYKGPSLPNTANLGELPSGWVWANLDCLKQFSMYGPRFSSEGYVADGTRVLRTTDFDQSGRIDLNTPPMLALTKAELEAYQLEAGDLLITRTGSLGTLAVFQGGVSAIAGAFLIYYRLHQDLLLPQFAFYFLKSPAGQRELRRRGTGVGRPNLNIPSIDSIPLPLPALNEQRAVIEGAEERLSVIDHLETDLETKLKSAQALRQSILKVAFEGNLVPQDPNDEPASELLRRIAAERSERERVVKDAKKAAKSAKVRRPKRGQNMSAVRAG